MKIVKYQKLKQGIYIIELEDGKEFKTYEDLILKYNLLIRKEISPHLLEEIREENKTYELYSIALKYLKSRMRSVKDVRTYLLKNNSSNNQVDSVVELLKKQGYLNDYNYAQAFTHDQISFSLNGPLKIRQELCKLELTEEQIDAILGSYTEEMEKTKIDKIIAKQVRTNHTKSDYFLRQKIYQHLMNLGYHITFIEQQLSSIMQDESEEENIYQREYQKLYRRLSRRYSGKELEFQLKQRLYQKGFRQK